jgi:TonB family protein
VGVRKGTTRAQVEALAASIGGRVTTDIEEIGEYQIEVPGASLEQLFRLADVVSRHPIVRGAAPETYAPGGIDPWLPAPPRNARPRPPPEQGLQPDNIQRGLATIKDALAACAARHATRGMVRVEITVAPEGRVTSATVVGTFAGTSVGACVAGAVRLARFTPFKGPAQSVTWPIILRH